MKKMIKHSLLALVLALGITGCATVKVMNVSKQSIVEKTSTDKIYMAINRASSGLGWIVSKVDNNTAIATLNLRSHQAIVTITYTDKDYSINYKSSIDLKYDAVKNTIHKNYNGWIQNLNNAIQIQLSSL